MLNTRLSTQPIKTKIIINRLIVLGINKWFHWEQAIGSDSFNNQVRSTFKEQNQMDWRNFFVGLASTDFATIQLSHCKWLGKRSTQVDNG